MLENEYRKKDMTEEELSLLDREMDRYRKEVNITYILWLFLGIFGIHNFYLGKIGKGILYFFTGALFLIGWLYDMVTIPQQVREYNDNLEQGIIDHLITLRRRNPS